MNINCIICSDLFSPSSEVFTTRCGHLFHYVCLITWLERSKTCPQCRQKSNDKSINRVYFNFPSTEGVTEDVVSLQSKLDSLNLNLRMKDVDYKVLNDKFTALNNEHGQLMNLSSANVAEIEKLKSAIGVLKEQMLYAKVKMKEHAKLEDELKAVKARAENLEHLNRGITGSIEDAQCVSRECNDIKTVKQVMLSLKSEVQELMKKKEKLFLQLKRTERELHVTNKELEDLKKINNVLSYANKTHEQCDPEKRALKRKLDELSELLENKKNDPTTEQPSHSQEKPKNLTASQKPLQIIDSPDLVTRAKQIKNSDSPYLQIKSNGMGMLLKNQGLSSRIGTTESTSIFRAKRSESEVKPKKLPDHLTPDGMGGFERNLGLFPNRAAFSQSLKRQKSANNLPSNKFKKLSKQQTNKMDDYLNISDMEK